VSREPRWIDRRVLLLLHEESLATFGGASGPRDEGLLDSALARPVNRFLHEGADDLVELAAAYCFGIAKNHAFIDGNKRFAFLSIGLFLAINGKRLRADPKNAVETMLAEAAGRLDEPGLARWIAAHLGPCPEP
jgi:death-on-curing protein